MISVLHMEVTFKDIVYGITEAYHLLSQHLYGAKRQNLVLNVSDITATLGDRYVHEFYKGARIGNNSFKIDELNGIKINRTGYEHGVYVLHEKDTLPHNIVVRIVITDFDKHFSYYDKPFRSSPADKK